MLCTTSSCAAGRCAEVTSEIDENKRGFLPVMAAASNADFCVVVTRTQDLTLATRIRTF